MQGECKSCPRIPEIIDTSQEPHLRPRAPRRAGITARGSLRSRLRLRRQQVDREMAEWRCGIIAESSRRTRRRHRQAKAGAGQWCEIIAAKGREQVGAAQLCVITGMPR